jgi:Leucine-rich repeat (LRR) protein
MIGNAEGCGSEVALPASIGRLGQLRVLKAYHGVWGKSLPRTIANLQNLEELDLRENDLRSMAQLMPLHKLKILSLADNRIREIPSSIGDLQDLEELEVGGNNIREIPSSIGDLQDLEELEVGGNNIRVVPPEIGNLHKLKKLTLAFNPVREIPSSVGNLTSLRELSLISSHGQNHPIELPESLTALEGLKVLMGNNYLKLKDQEKLRNRFPKLVFDFSNDPWDGNGAGDANEGPPEPKPGAATRRPKRGVK